MTKMQGVYCAAAEPGCFCVQRTFREIMFLQELTTHDNIIKCALRLKPV